MNYNIRTEKSIGFIYLTKIMTLNKFYIGKKLMKGKNKSYGKNKWENYMGSNDIIKDNFDDCIKCIIYWCDTKMEMTYTECKFQFELNVLDDDRFLNKNILGKFYKTK